MNFKLLSGDCRETLKTLPDNSVDMCCTSPPYWRLRAYLPPDHPLKAQEIGSESTLAGHLANLVEIFEQVRRVLKPSGTLWINYGDAYSNGTNDKKSHRRDKAECSVTGRRPPPGFKAKDLMGLPWRVAFNLQEAGWYLRCDIIWHKPNPMPESVYDRPTRAHEYVFLFSKRATYYYDAEAIAEPVSLNTHARMSQDIANQVGSARANGGTKTNGNMKAVLAKIPINPKARGSETKQNESFAAGTAGIVSTRNKRSVWTIASQPFGGAHFATMPEALVKPCVLAGCPVGGVVLDPFLGSGTVAKVAIELGRNAIGCELNDEYEPMSTHRTNVTAGLAL